MPKRVVEAVKSSSLYARIFVIFLCICLILGVFSFQYYSRLQQTLRKENSDYLQEISRRIGNNISRIIQDNFAALHTMEATLQVTDVESFAMLQPIIEMQKNYWDYADLMLVDVNGRAYNATGKEVFLNMDATLTNTIVNQEDGLYTGQMVGEREYIMFSVPLDSLMVDGKRMMALIASYDAHTFDQVLSMSAFNGQAYSQIITTSGTMVVRPTAVHAIQTGYNFLTAMEAENPQSIAQLQADMSGQKEGQIQLSYNGVRYYTVYSSVLSDNWYLLTLVPVSAVNAKSDLLLRITLLICGVITLAFSGLLAALFFVFTRSKRDLERVAYVDPVTGGNTIQRFYDLAGMLLASPQGPTYALVYSNLAKFKVLNEQFGRATCDDILKAFYHNINSNLAADEALGRISADNFCILMTYESETSMISRFEAWYENARLHVEENHNTWPLPITEFGVYVIENKSLPFPQMIDRAKLALRESPYMLNNKLRYAFYDDEVRRRLFREKQLEDMMEQALREREFQVYLQPKYHTQEEKIVGAEALIRWVSKTEGMIFPDEFISLFEKNGFIVQLDLWVFEEVCKNQRQWIDRGFSPVQISVNCSRVHLKDSKFYLPYLRIAEKYKVPPRLLEIEFTESVVMEETDRLIDIINEIHRFGMGCSMDDFGSGYSSLNMIRTIPVDTLKLDKIFFKGDNADLDRVESVIGSIVSMAQALSMHTVAEGIESHTQVELLKRVGCDMVQGYVFAKPMPIPDFEKLAFGQQE